MCFGSSGTTACGTGTVFFGPRGLMLCVQDWSAMNRHVLYLICKSAVGLRYEAGSPNDFIETEANADWHGCEKDAANGVVSWFLLVSSALSPKLNKTVACSSAEREYNSLCTGVAESIFVSALVNVIGMGIKHIHMCGDRCCHCQGAV